MNGALATRANATATSYECAGLVMGIDWGGSWWEGAHVGAGFSRRQWIVFTLWSMVGVPAAFLVVFTVLSIRRRK
jgi:hypothetical protein